MEVLKIVLGIAEVLAIIKTWNKLTILLHPNTLLSHSLYMKVFFFFLGGGGGGFVWVFCGLFVCVYKTYKGEREKKMFYLMTHSTHFIYDYMASDMAF